MDNTKFWLGETTKFPISNINLAANYIAQKYGSNIVIGILTLRELVTEETFNRMVDMGYFTRYDEEAFIFTERR